MSDKLVSEFYEVLDAIEDEGGYARLTAAFTPNNGIRIHIEDIDDGEGDVSHSCEFDFTDAQAEMIGQALVRWAQRRRAEAELIRCGGRGSGQFSKP